MEPYGSLNVTIEYSSDTKEFKDLKVGDCFVIEWLYELRKGYTRKLIKIDSEKCLNLCEKETYPIHQDQLCRVAKLEVKGKGEFWTI